MWKIVTLNFPNAKPLPWHRKVYWAVKFKLLDIKLKRRFKNNPLSKERIKEINHSLSFILIKALCSAHIGRHEVTPSKLSVGLITVCCTHEILQEKHPKFLKKYKEEFKEISKLAELLDEESLALGLELERSNQFNKSLKDSPRLTLIREISKELYNKYLDIYDDEGFCEKDFPHLIYDKKERDFFLKVFMPLRKEKLQKVLIRPPDAA